MRRLTGALALLLVLGMSVSASAAFAGTVFSDTFDGTIIDESKWEISSDNEGGSVFQNGQLVLQADNSGSPFEVELETKPFHFGEDVESVLISGTWKTSNFTSGRFGIEIFDSASEDSPWLKIGYGFEEGTWGLGAWSGTGDSGEFTAFGPRSVPVADTDFAILFNGPNWKYFENGEELGSGPDLFEDASGNFGLGLGIGGDNGAGQTLYVDNIMVQTNVAPEPLSCALFLLGGGVLAVVRRRKG